MTRGAAQAALAVQALKASGAVVQVEPEVFLALLQKGEQPLVVVAQGRLVKSNHYYLTSYKGLIFSTKSAAPLPLPQDAELITAKEIWLPA
jgi:hypothetical protein